MATPRKRWWSPVVRAALSSKILERPHLLRTARAIEGIQLTPQNLRILWSRIEAARAESHHVCAQQLALGRSGGVFTEHVELFAALCSAPGRDAVRELRRVRLGASARLDHRPRAYVRKRREAIDRELKKKRDMTENLGESITSSLPKWSVKAAGAAMHHGARIHHIMSHFGVEFAPNNIRSLWAARAEARIEQHHNNALQIALIESKGCMNAFGRLAAKWTAIKDADEAEKANMRMGKRLHDVGLRVHDTAKVNRQALIAALVRMGLASDDDGGPVPGLEERRSNGLRQSYMHAYYEDSEEDEQSLARLLSRAAKPASEKEKRKHEEDAMADGLLDWMDEEEPGKTIHIEDPPAISRCVIIHSAPEKPLKAGASDEDARHKLRQALANKKEIGPAHSAHQVDEIASTAYVEAPWHAEALSWIRDRHHEAIRNPEKCTQFPPLMLIGPPGCGKTFLMTRLAELLELPSVRMDMTGAMEPWPIAGGAWGWRNAQPGVAVKTIIETGHANPLIMLDEIEKAGKTDHGSPLNALLPVLQSETARQYRCPYLEAEVDLSRVSWVMLGNSLAGVPAPLRDRVTIIEARGPRGLEIRHLAQRLLGELAADQRVVDAAAHAVESGRMSLRGLHRLARDFRALVERPALN